MLMAIGEALPEHVFAHGFLTVRNAETGKAEKMSKSRGNAIAPQALSTCWASRAIATTS